MKNKKKQLRGNDMVLEKKTYTVKELKDVLGISLSLAYAKLRNGELPAIKLGSRFIISKVQIEKLLNGELPTKLQK